MEHGSDSSTSMKKVVPPDQDTASEQSGWTTYLQDFSGDNDRTGEEGNKVGSGGGSGCGYYCSSSYCSSLVSDATSHAHRRSVLPNISDHKVKMPEKVNLVKKTTRAQEITLEDPLEDTASSPVNSPKMVDLNKLIDMGHINPKFEGKDGGSIESGPGFQTDAGSIEYEEGDDEYPCGLKKRGLCLVPLSLFMG